MPRSKELADGPTLSKVNTIIGGSAKEGDPVKKQKIEEVNEAITFTWPDIEGVQYLHNDIMIINMNITSYDIHHMLIANESFMDVLFYEALLKMNIFLEWLERTYMQITGFFGEPVPIKRTIVLLVIASQAR